MKVKYGFVAGDTGSVLSVTCINNDDDSIIDLTDVGGVTLRWLDSGGTLVEKTMTIDNAVGGLVSYKFGASELFAGTMSFEVKITDGAGKILHSLVLLDVQVRAPLT